MTTKEWFLRCRHTDRRIDSLISQAEAEYARVTSITAKLDSVTVDGSHDPHRFDGYAALMAEINAEIDGLYQMKQEAHAVIRQIPDVRYRDLLTKRYVESKAWERVADEMGYDTFYVKGALHGAALDAARPFVPKDDTF